MTGSISDAVRSRLAGHGLKPSSATIDSLVDYFGLLTKWNKTINLTAFDLEKLTRDLQASPEGGRGQPVEILGATIEKAFDRLLTEPLVAAHVVTASLPGAAGLRLLDIGSGGQ